MKKQYVILTDQKEFYAIDYQSGGYGYFTNLLSSAHFFNSMQEAKDVLDGQDFHKECKMSDGTIFPPRLVQMAAGICNKKTKGTCILRIAEVSFSSVYVEEFEGEIKKPTGFTYD